MEGAKRPRDQHDAVNNAELNDDDDLDLDLLFGPIVEVERMQCRKPYGCSLWFPKTDFETRRLDGKVTLRQKCKRCRNKMNTHLESKKIKYRETTDGTTSLCVRCHATFKHVDMAVTVGGSYSSTCKSCSVPVGHSNDILYARKKHMVYELKKEHIMGNGASCKRCMYIFLKTDLGHPIQCLDAIDGNVTYMDNVLPVREFLEAHFDLLDLDILEFDHLPQFTKINVITCMPPSLMRAEAQKCQMVCGRCHVIVTTERATAKRELENRTLAKQHAARQHINMRKLEVGGCALCGHFDKNLLAFFHWDHLNPATKIACVSEMASNHTLDEIDKEIAKCQLLCKHCHRKRTLDQYKNGELVNPSTLVVPERKPEPRRKSAVGTRGLVYKRWKGRIIGVTAMVFFDSKRHRKYFSMLVYKDQATVEREAAKWVNDLRDARQIK